MKFDRFFTAVESVYEFPTYGFSENEFCGHDVEELYRGVMTQKTFFELDETPEDEKLFYFKIAKRIDSSVIKASGADSLMDCISTSAVLISSIIIYLIFFCPSIHITS